MFKLKELLDGIVEDTLELPAMWIRTHILALACDRRSTFIMARRIKHGDKRYLKLRTAAFCDLLILYAIATATNTNSGIFVNNVLATLLQPQNIPLASNEFLSLLIAFFAFYYAFYLIIAWLPIAPETAHILVGACLFYSILCVAVFFIVFLFLFGNGSIFATDFVLRGTIYAFDALVFWRLGAIFSSLLHLRRRMPVVGTTACAITCFAVYISIVSICFGFNTLWPNLNA